MYKLCLTNKSSQSRMKIFVFIILDKILFKHEFVPECHFILIQKSFSISKSIEIPNYVIYVGGIELTLSRAYMMSPAHYTMKSKFFKCSYWSYSSVYKYNVKWWHYFGNVSTSFRSGLLFWIVNFKFISRKLVR